MAYAVSITPQAERDFSALYLSINASASDAALNWYRGFKDAILSLDESPYRCPVTPENAQLRHLLYGNKPHIYRVIFEVDEPHNTVWVLHIRHGARRPFRASELK